MPPKKNDSSPSYWKMRPFPNFGDSTYSHGQLIRELEQHPKVVKAVEQYPQKRSWVYPFQSPVRRYLKEMVAKPSSFVVHIARVALAFLWNKIFNGVNVQGLDEIAQDYQGKSLIYIPCHRSHLDYGLLSWILGVNFLPLPHIIAGNNLNLFGIGQILKMGGAVFIRRSFKEQPLYTETFLTYLHYLLDHQYSIEFFIEGGRSRAGKHLQPKVGFLSMLVEYLQQRPDMDLHLVPVSVVYDKVMEESSYVKELGGIPKRAENLSSLFRSYKLFQVNYGKVYVSFTKPISLREMMVASATQYQVPIADLDRVEQYKNIVYEYGLRIMDLIDSHTTTSTIPFIATALLSQKKQGFRKKGLLLKSQQLLDVYHLMHPRAKETVIMGENGIEDGIEFLFQNRSMGCLPDAQGDIYFFKYEDKIRLNLTKNVTIRHFVIPSLIALQVLKDAHSQLQLRQNILFFERLFRNEFVFPQSFDFAESIKKMINYAKEQQWVVYDRATKSYRANLEKKEELELLARIVMPFKEALQATVYTVVQTEVPFPLYPKALTKHIQKNFVKLHLLGEFEFPEANLTITYQNIIKFFIQEKYLHSYQDTDRKMVIDCGPKFDLIAEPLNKLI